MIQGSVRKNLGDEPRLKLNASNRNAINKGVCCEENRRCFYACKERKEPECTTTGCQVDMECLGQRNMLCDAKQKCASEACNAMKYDDADEM